MKRKSPISRIIVSILEFALVMFAIGLAIVVFYAYFPVPLIMAILYWRLQVRNEKEP